MGIREVGSFIGFVPCSFSPDRVVGLFDIVLMLSYVGTFFKRQEGVFSSLRKHKRCDNTNFAISFRIKLILFYVS